MQQSAVMEGKREVTDSSPVPGINILFCFLSRFLGLKA